MSLYKLTSFREINVFFAGIARGKEISLFQYYVFYMSERIFSQLHDTIIKYTYIVMRKEKYQ